MPKDSGIGTSPKRREDVRFLTGNGKYTDDINLTGQSHAVFARSDVAHGKINNVDISVAENMPGVLAIFTGEDFADVGIYGVKFFVEGRWVTVIVDDWFPCDTRIEDVDNTTGGHATETVCICFWYFP